DRVKDWVEKTTTTLGLDHDLIVVEALAVRNMTRSARGTVARPGRNLKAKAGLNREILARRWGLFLRRLKAESRESQATFRCVACGHTEHADTNAARNILAAGRAVTARGGEQSSPSSREPQPRGLQAA
ncbi:MAG TPA: zinc ribbon domain-containing protein, partial [Acidimicrobiia bacterium]